MSTQASIPSTVQTKQRPLGLSQAMVAVFDSPDGQNVLSASDGQKLKDCIFLARQRRIPFVAQLTTTAVTMDDGLGPADGWASVARQLSLASGAIPTIAIVSGPVVAGPALLLGLFDITIFTDDAYVFVTGPRSVEAYTGEPVTTADLGGSSVHARTTGVASLVADSLDTAYELASDVLSFLPSHVDECPATRPCNDPFDRPTPEAADLLPESAFGSYDVRDIVEILADDGDFLELKASWAPNLVTGFASIAGQSVGVVANQTQALAGSIDIPASQKGARFVAMCDAFNVPLLTLVDTSGFLPGKDLEWRGMIRHGAQLAFAYARATVPRVGVILRKSYGGAYIVMDSAEMGNDIMLAWPSAEVAVMGAKGAVEILHRKSTPEEKTALEVQYEQQFLTPYPAAERLAISSVINPADTRREVTAAFELLKTKKEKLRRRRHDNGPL